LIKGICGICYLAHGASQEEALAHINVWIDTAKKFGDPIPEPKGHRLMYA